MLINKYKFKTPLKDPNIVAEIALKGQIDFISTMVPLFSKAKSWMRDDWGF